MTAEGRHVVDCGRRKDCKFVGRFVVPAEGNPIDPLLRSTAVLYFSRIGSLLPLFQRKVIETPDLAVQGNK